MIEAEGFRFPDELIAEGLSNCETHEQAMQFALEIAYIEAIVNRLMRPPPPRRRWPWRRR